MTKNAHQSENSSPNAGKKDSPQKTSFLQAIVLILCAVLLFFTLLEGGLALFGVQSILKDRDPFVGFAGNVPLFTESAAPNGARILVTTKNKLSHFNPQMFVKEKAADTYRIFCLGGSTTYGRPYNSQTSFAGWLKELLPAADKSRDWEVINAGGISYASYRVARLMEDLVQYQPDLFIIYTGQNEFLEERTYGELRKVPEALRAIVGLLAKTRTWAALETVLEKIGVAPQQAQPKQVELAAEVDTILDHSTGPEDYHRDDDLRPAVFEHYRVSLQRMVDIARKAGAEVIFVTPASNLKDCSPFKSEHSIDLNTAQKEKVESWLNKARRNLALQQWAAALALLDHALSLDPRMAELHFRRGQALFGMQRYEEARGAFVRARDEDVCPLRALTPMPGMVADVAKENDFPLVDFVAIIEQRLQIEQGHQIPGEEYFLDHVHPTISGHRLLALSLIETMINQSIVQPQDNWGEGAIATVDAKIKSRINPQLQAKSLINLAKVLRWAGKFEDAKRLAAQGLNLAKGEPKLTGQASNILVKLAKQQGATQEIDQYIQQALEIDPWSPIMHYQLGVQLMQQKLRKQGAAHILFATAFWDTNQTNSVLGLIQYNNGRLELAYPLLKKALLSRPGDKVTQAALSELRKQLGPQVENLPVPQIIVRRYRSGVPKDIYLQKTTADGRSFPDGFLTEWYKSGRLKRYVDLTQGLQHGVEIQWSPQGELELRRSYQRGVIVED